MYGDALYRSVLAHFASVQECGDEVAATFDEVVEGVAARTPAPSGPKPDFFPGASLRSQVLSHALRVTVKPLLAVWAQWPSSLWPAGLIDPAARIVPPLRGVGRQSVRLENCDAELIDAGNTGTAPAWWRLPDLRVEYPPPACFTDLRVRRGSGAQCRLPDDAQTSDP